MTDGERVVGTGTPCPTRSDTWTRLETLLSEKAAADAGFTPYVESAGREGAGVSHPLLDNPDWSAFYLIKQGRRVEENIARCPKTWAAIEAIGEAHAKGQPTLVGTTSIEKSEMLSQLLTQAGITYLKNL